MITVVVQNVTVLAFLVYNFVQGPEELESRMRSMSLRSTIRELGERN